MTEPKEEEDHLIAFICQELEGKIQFALELDVGLHTVAAHTYNCASWKIASARTLCYLQL